LLHLRIITFNKLSPSKIHFQMKSESVACTILQLIIKKQLHASVPSGSSITITKTCAITKTKTLLINNANINLKIPLIKRKPLVGKHNRT
jgi:hypothetical protein